MAMKTARKTRGIKGHAANKKPMSQDNLLAGIHQNSERGHHKRRASRAQGQVTFDGQ